MAVYCRENIASAGRVMMAAVVRAIVLAAGASSRMGRPKAALPLTDRADTFLSRILRTFSAAGLGEIVVVTGGAAETVRKAAGRTRRNVRFVHNDGWPQGQLSSLLCGLQERDGNTLEAALVTLVDVPLTSIATVQSVLGAWRRTRAPLVRPSCGDAHGHPVVFDRALFPALRAADPGQGAKSVVRAHAGDILNVPVDDPGAFLDIDDAETYERVIGRPLEPLRHG